MNLSEALFLIIRSVFFVLTFLAAATVWHDEGKRRLELILMFASAAFVIVVYTMPSEGLPAWVGILAMMAVVAHPPLILRLLSLLRPISLMMQRASLGGMVVVWLLLLITSAAWHRPVVVSYFLAFESLALLACIEGRKTGAFLRWRFLFIAAGICFFVVLLLLLATGQVMAEPHQDGLLTLLILVLVIFAGLSYLFGFAPPSWLEQIWQFMHLSESSYHLSRAEEAQKEEVKRVNAAKKKSNHKEAHVDQQSIGQSFSDNQELLSLLIESSLDGIFAFDHDCRYTIWNPAMARLSGVSHEEAIGQYAFELFPFLEETGEDRFFYRALAGQSVIAQDRPFRVPKTGREVFFMGSYAPLRNQAGEIVGGVGVIHEITKRKQAEEEIRRQATRANALVRAAARLNTPLNLPAVVQAICEEATYALQVPIATVSLYDSQENVFIPAGEVGLPADAHELLPPPSRL